MKSQLTFLSLLAIGAFAVPLDKSPLDDSGSPKDKREAIVINCIKKPGAVCAKPEVAINIIDSDSQLVDASKGETDPNAFYPGQFDYTQQAQQPAAPQQLMSQPMVQMLPGAQPMLPAQQSDQQVIQLVPQPMDQLMGQTFSPPADLGRFVIQPLMTQPQAAPDAFQPQMFQLPFNQEQPQQTATFTFPNQAPSQQLRMPAAIQPIYIPMPSNMLGSQPIVSQQFPQLQQMFPDQKSPQTIQLVLQSPETRSQFPVAGGDGSKPIQLPCICTCFA